MINNYSEVISKAFNEALVVSEKPSKNLAINLPQNTIELINTICKNMSSTKGVITVLITSLVEKIVHPNQDVRNHQSQIPNGYAGRTIDTNYVTPFLKSKKLLSMSESGWLTRSLEQPVPYNLDYPGKISNTDVKNAFLQILYQIEEQNIHPYPILVSIFYNMIIDRDSSIVSIDLHMDNVYTINSIIQLISDHFYKSTKAGKSRLPTIAIYSIYQCMIREFKRYDQKILKPLASHTSSDLRSGDIGDIQINDSENNPFEGIEVKFEKPIKRTMIYDAYQKFKPYPVERYYILSTKPIESVDEKNLIENDILSIRNEHGCQIIINGIIPTIKYYLRLIDNPNLFIDNYTTNVLQDSALKSEHRQLWEKLLHEHQAP